MATALEGIRVIELASAHAAFAGKLLADLGADVIVVEPPGGHASRGFGPFADDEPGVDNSLFWWHYNTSKRSVELDLEDQADRERFRAIVASADVVLEGEDPGRLAALDVDHDALRAANPRLVWVSLTPFGRSTTRAHEPATDLTLLSGGGPVWSCGYDDHTIPPVRGGGNQGYHTGALYAVLGALTALVARDARGIGQHVDVSMHAAANVTTETATYAWLLSRSTVQRQTTRHATEHRTLPLATAGADGRWVHTGFPPRTAAELGAVIAWLDELGMADEAPSALLALGVERGGIRLEELGADPVATEIFAAGREAVMTIASKLDAYDFFVGSQERGIACGIIYAPDEVFSDPHFVARGFPVAVDHDGREVTYPGAPFVAHGSPWRIAHRAPRVGEHNDAVLGALPEWREP